MKNEHNHESGEKKVEVKQLRVRIRKQSGFNQLAEKIYHLLAEKSNRTILKLSEMIYGRSFDTYFKLILMKNPVEIELNDFHCLSLV
jgi:hypothetical protein